MHRDPSGRLVFKGGRWAGYHGKVLASGRLGLTAHPKASFYEITCDRRGG